MAFIMSSFLGGAAKRASEIMQEERENTQKIVDQSMRLWTELGIPAYKEHKNKRKTLRTQMEELSDRNFSTDQIGLIAKQGKLSEVLEHIKNEEKYGYAVKPADVARLAPDFKSSGMTMDQYLDAVAGSVRRGNTISDAIQDAGGKSKGFLGQDLSGIAQKRAAAFKTGMGMDITELASFARDDLEYADLDVSGEIVLKSRVSELAAQEAEQGVSGKATPQGTKRNFENMAGIALGAKLNKNPLTGEYQTEFDDVEKQGISLMIAAQTDIYYKQLIRGSDEQPAMTSEEAYQEALKYAKRRGEEELANYSGKPKGVVEKGQQPQQSSDIPGGLPDYSGIDMKQLPSMIKQNLEGVTDATTRTALIRQAEREIRQRLMQQGMTNESEINEAVRSILGSLQDS